ncbi:linear amide C-N hydrolase [Paenibacillus sp. TRM 82003]|nr:linear amide C-N hydrolase [Paenibacillus sp. TRM 82003]
MMSTAIYLERDKTRLLMKNQDVPYTGGYLFSNNRNIAKSALVQVPEQPAKWVSRYGSLTISQVGKEMPNGGINEAGLAVEQTTLWTSSYPEDISLPVIGELQWIQRILDTCATVEEAKQAAKSVRIAQPMSRLHYMLADRTGDCAVIEFVDGCMCVYDGNTLPVRALANTPYVRAVLDFEDEEQRWESYEEYERNSMERFVISANRLVNVNDSVKGEHILDYALVTLQKVRREDTAYSLIYDLNEKQLFFTSGQCPDMKTIRLQELDFSPCASTIAINLQESAVEGRPQMMRYETGLNRKVAESFFRDPILTEAFKWNISDEMIDFFAAFPNQFATV